MCSLVALVVAAAVATMFGAIAATLIAVDTLATAATPEPGTLSWFNTLVYPHLKDGRADGEVGTFTNCSDNFDFVNGYYCANGDGYITHVRLNGAGLSGTLPSLLGQMTAIVYFDVGNNDIGGTIPTEIGEWVSIAYFYVFSNNLRGIIPTEIAQWQSIVDFYTVSNNLTGAIPPLRVRERCRIALAKAPFGNTFDCPVPNNLSSTCTSAAPAVTRPCSGSAARHIKVPLGTSPTIIKSDFFRNDSVLVWRVDAIGDGLRWHFSTFDLGHNVRDSVRIFDGTVAHLYTGSSNGPRAGASRASTILVTVVTFVSNTRRPGFSLELYSDAPPTTPPTSAPSATPTMTPTVAPSTAPPTKSPTSAPSAAPTITPTAAPIHTRVDSPTHTSIPVFAFTTTTPHPFVVTTTTPTSTAVATPSSLSSSPSSLGAASWWVPRLAGTAVAAVVVVFALRACTAYALRRYRRRQTGPGEPLLNVIDDDDVAHTIVPGDSEHSSDSSSSSSSASTVIGATGGGGGASANDDDSAAVADTINSGDPPPTRCFDGVPLMSFDEAMRLLLSFDADVPDRPDVSRPGAEMVTLVPKHVRSKYEHTVSQRAEVRSLIAQYGLTDDDVLAMTAYTAEQPFPTYRWFNAWLNCAQRDEAVKAHVGPYFVLLFRALQKLPVQEVSASRGVRVGNIPKLVKAFDNWQVRFADGAFVGHWGLSSYTTDPDVEVKFAGKGKAIVYLCKHLRCVSIMPFSLMQSEDEVLPLPPATFRVHTAVCQKRLLRVLLVQQPLAANAYVSP